jgi:hypothetical protein
MVAPATPGNSTSLTDVTFLQELMSSLTEFEPQADLLSGIVAEQGREADRFAAVESLALFFRQTLATLADQVETGTGAQGPP